MEEDIKFKMGKHKIISSEKEIIFKKKKKQDIRKSYLWSEEPKRRIKVHRKT